VGTARWNAGAFSIDLYGAARGGLWGLVSDLHASVPALAFDSVRDQRRNYGRRFVLHRSADARSHFHGRESDSMTHFGCARSGLDGAVPESDAQPFRAMKSPSLRCGGLGPPQRWWWARRPQSITWRWPTSQTGHSGSRGSISTIASKNGGKSLRQCGTISLRRRLERNPKCLIFTNPLGEYMQQEPPDERDCIQGRLFDLILVPRVSPVKPHTSVLQA
jgi:hypothetical protein